MNKKKSGKQSVTSRRGFLKNATAFSLGTLAMSSGFKAFANLKTDNKKTQNFTLLKKEHNILEDIYEISPDYNQMDQKNTIFSRVVWDKCIQNRFVPLGGKMKGMIPNPLKIKSGYSPVDHALALGAVAGVAIGTGLSPAGQRSGGVLNNWDVYAGTNVSNHKHSFESDIDAATYVKKAGVFYGASDVGIAPYDKRWIYSNWYDIEPFFKEQKDGIHEKSKFPFEVKSVIVTLHEMDYQTLLCPGSLNEASVQKGYSDMAEVTHKIASFLNHLGYKAIPAGNDTGLSVPPALQAGLGECSRMGMLIHPKYGSRTRIAKVYTNLEIKPDKPITFGVTEFCKKCKKCAELCPSDAISLEKEPFWEPKTNSVSSHPGVKKWYQNGDKCIEQWERQGGGCGICIAVCPYNKLDTWVHDVAKVAVGIPVGRDIAREFDDAFGYGKIEDSNVDKFWHSENID